MYGFSMIASVPPSTTSKTNNKIQKARLCTGYKRKYMFHIFPVKTQQEWLFEICSCLLGTYAV